MRNEDDSPAAIAALLALTEHGVPADIQELLVYGNPLRGVKPGALRAAFSAYLQRLVARDVDGEKDAVRL